MADSAGRLDKLSRLKSLRSGLKARSAPAEAEDVLSLDTMFEDDREKRASEPAKPAPVPAPAPSASGEDDDAESLSAYFEALGIVPDGAGKSGATGTPPEPYTPPSKAYTKPADRGRDVDVRDRWADPVREDESYLSSFAGDPPVRPGGAPVAAEAPPAAQPAPAVEGPALFVEPAASGEEATGFTIEETPFEPEETTGNTNDASVEAFGPPEAVEPDPSGSMSPDDDGKPVARDEEGAQTDLPDDLPDDLPEDLQDDAETDFDKSIDIEAFEREIAMADSARKGTDEPPVEADAAPSEPEAEAGESLSITFDPDRAAMLKQVSDRMGCSVDDVVVTAIDWYLDALLEDEDGANAESSEA